jgi:hypothetical protein
MLVLPTLDLVNLDMGQNKDTMSFKKGPLHIVGRYFNIGPEEQSQFCLKLFFLSLLFTL